MINLIDLKAQHDSIKDELESAMNEVISKSQFIGGDALTGFEKKFASYCGEAGCVGTSSGSTALFTALKCLGIKEGDEVILPVNTFIATAFAVTLCGAKPVFADVNESDALISVSEIEKKITEKTKAIIPVHLYGRICDMDKIKEIAGKKGLKIVEDCAQCHGSSYKGKKAPLGNVGCFSFFPSKSLGSLGDAGCIVSSDIEFLNKCRKFVNHGRAEKYLHETEGFNFRMDNLQAAVLNVKLSHLNNWIEKKISLARNYDLKLNELVELFKDSPENIGSYYLYVIKSESRDSLKEWMKSKGIETGVHYPIPLHLQPAFFNLGYKEGDFPVAEMLSKKILSIPIYPEMTEEQQNSVISSIESFFHTS